MKKISIIGVLMGAAIDMRNSDLSLSVPRQRVVNLAEFRGSKNRAAIDTGSVAGSQPASAPQSISPLRDGMVALLTTKLCLFKLLSRHKAVRRKTTLSAGSVAINKTRGQS